MALVCKWTRRALLDIDHIEEYIAQDNPAASIDIVKKIVLTIEEQLGHYPSAGRSGRVPGTRELILSGTSYLAAYRVRGDVVEVLRVLHSARKWPDSF